MPTAPSDPKPRRRLSSPAAPSLDTVRKAPAKRGSLGATKVVQPSSHTKLAVTSKSGTGGQPHPDPAIEAALSEIEQTTGPIDEAGPDVPLPDDQTPEADDQGSPGDQVPPVTGGGEDSRHKPRKRRSKKVFRLELAGLALLLILGGFSWWWFHRPAAVHLAARVPVHHKPTPTTVADPLTGQLTSVSSAGQPVIGVMIENLDPDARPQSGLGQAGVVYEALAEGGITRFLAIFQEPLPSIIGPVRSLRPYYLDWGLEYNIPVAHAGGSQPALAQVGPLHLKDINALAYDGSYFYRATDRAAPHNLYTNSQLLPALDTKLGFATSPAFTPLPRKADTPETTPTHPTIDITFSYAGYNVEYRYTASTDSYARFMGGTAHIDRDTGQQISVKNVVVEFVPTTYSTQADGKPETDMNLVGQGKALVFDDGGVTDGTWNKSSVSAQTKLLDANGKSIAVNRGNTWYEVVPTTNTVTY